MAESSSAYSPVSAEQKWTKENVLRELLSSLGPRKKHKRQIEVFVGYYFAHVKKRTQVALSEQDLLFLYEKCKKGIEQTEVHSVQRQRKLHSSRPLKDETVIGECSRVNGKAEGTRGWIPGWLTAQAKDAFVGLELDEAQFVTKMMVYAVNVKASPRSMELHGKNAKGEWVLVRGFQLRDRTYEGSHGQEDYNKFEMFVVLGDRSNQQETVDDDWEFHPLAGPGDATGNPDNYLKSKSWRWKILDANGAHYVGINDFILYGRKASLEAPKSVNAKAHSNGAKISWSKTSQQVHRYEIVAYPGGFGRHANGGFFESCSGTATEYFFFNLSPGTKYQFQVIAVTEDGEDGIPSKATNPVVVAEWNPKSDHHETDREEDHLLEGIAAADIQEESMEEIAPLDIQLNQEAVEEESFPEEETAIKEMLRGKFKAVETLMNSNKVTMYISGSLEDTNVEREYISNYVIPKLTMWCSANGYDFSGIDLRWGLSTELSNDHKTLSIHLSELQRAYQNSCLMVFCFISGERFGSMMLPPILSIEDRNVIHNSMKPSVRWILDYSYKLDSNGEPPVYVLNSISEIEASGKPFTDHGSKLGISSLLKEAIAALSKEETISKEFKSWEASLTIAEVKLALKETEKSDMNKCISFVRTFNGLYQAMETEKDLPLNLQKARLMACEDTKHRQIITELRRTVSHSNNVEAIQYSFDWNLDGIDIGREDAAMRDLCCQLYSRMKQIIEDSFANRKLFSDAEQEFIHHAAFVKKRAESFVGRDTLVKTVMAHILASENKITVLHGVSGAGKTSVLCSVSYRWKFYLPENAVVMVRLCGTSPRSSSAKGILRSLCLQLKQALLEEETIPDEFDELVQCFASLLEKGSEIAPLGIFIDSLDQLTDEDDGRSQPWKWIPKKLPDNVYLIVSTLPDSEYGILQALQEISPLQVEVPLVPSLEGKILLWQWLHASHRTVTAEQRNTVAASLDKVASGISMLHLRLLYDRVVKWSSDHKPTDLPTTVQGMIELTYRELEKEHGEKLVSGFLALLGCSHDGLSVENIANILSADEHSLGGKHVPGSILEHYSPPVRRVPPYLLARLKHDLSEYLVEKGANGIKVLGLYHRQFIEVSHKLYIASRQRREEVCQMLCEYFSGESSNKFIERGIASHPFWYFIDVDKRAPNRQKLVELPEALIQCGNYEDFGNLIMNFEYIEAKFTAGGQYATSLISEYGLAIKGLPEGQLVKDVRAFYRFIMTWFHVLLKNPSCLTSLALNYIPDSVVTIKMRQKWDSRYGMEGKGWIQWQNAPRAIDPCISTNVLSRAECLTRVKISPNRQSYIVTGKSFSVICDLQTAHIDCDYNGHTMWVRSACFSPEGRFVLTVSNDKTGKVWNSENGETCCVLSGHLSWVLDCGWSSIDDLVFTASDDGTVRLWNPYLGTLLGVFEEHGSSVRCGKFSHCGKYLITGDADGKILKWPTSGPHKIMAKCQLEQAVNCVDWNSEKSIIAAALYSGDVVLLTEDLQISNVFKDLLKYSANTCVFHPDGDELLVAGAEKIGVVINAATGEIKGKLVGHNRQITGAEWFKSSDDSLIVTSCEDQTVKTWKREDIIPGDVFETFAEGSWKPSSAFGLGFTKEGELYGLDNDLNIYHCSPVIGFNPPLPFLTKMVKGPDFGDKTSSSLSLDGSTWLFCNYGGKSMSLSAADGKVLKEYHMDVAHNCMRWDPTGKPRFLAQGHGVGSRIWNSETGETDCDLNIPVWTWDASWSLSGQYLAISTDSNTCVFDLHRPYSKGDTIDPVFSGMESFRCAIIADGSRVGIVAKTGRGYDSAPTAGYLYKLDDLNNVPEPIHLIGEFQHAVTMMFSSNSQYLFASFKSLAFGTSPSICAYDSDSGSPLAWFVSPMNVNFARLAVPYQPSSQLIVSDASGKLYLLAVQES